jgi:hypothetical protein
MIGRYGLKQLMLLFARGNEQPGKRYDCNKPGEFHVRIVYEHVKSSIDFIKFFIQLSSSIIYFLKKIWRELVFS